jgi:hypothetical protein
MWKLEPEATRRHRRSRALVFRLAAHSNSAGAAAAPGHRAGTQVKCAHGRADTRVVAQHTDEQGRRLYQSDALPDPLGRARSFVAAAIEHCNAHDIAPEDLLANPEGVLTPVANEHGLLVKLMATGDGPFEVAVVVVGDASSWPLNDLGMVCVSPGNTESPPRLSFYPADSLVAPSS